ncbi:MAG: T9SS type A sorting domain-containing protein [Ignavibacteria bacterium]|nr:T9SS type A sorting domain-containing protein [Ignavibacteria bacterium]
MKNLVLLKALLLLLAVTTFSKEREGYIANTESPFAPAQSIFLQSGNINTVFRTDGYFNYDKVTFTTGDAGFIWPVAAAQRMTAVFTSGLWIGAKVNIAANQKELRLAASFYNTHYSPGNIPVMGQVPPSSVCSDPAFNGYLVSLNDQSLVNGGTITKNAGGRTYTFVYSSWAAWPVGQGAPYVEVNGIPGYQPGWNSDRPGTGNGNARPSEMIFSVFMDYTNCTNNPHASELSLPGGTLPLGVEVQQLAYAFDADGFRDSYFIRYKIINKSGKVWDSTFVGLVNDADLGDASDDVTGCDTTRNTGFTYNFDDNDLTYGAAPPAVGYRMLQGPVVYTGNNSDTAKLPCNTMVGYKMKLMTGHFRFFNGGSTCFGDPDSAAVAYNILRGKDGCGNTLINFTTGQPTTYMYPGDACTGTGWIDNTSGDVRNVMNSGPFTMNSGDTQVVVYSFTIARGSSNNQSVCALLNSSDNINNFYYDCFNLIGIEPINNTIPKQFSLEQNYPNPFNPNTSVKFSIPKSGFVKLVIYDALGREVKELLNENVAAGIYSLDFNAADYPSGIYFYRLSAEGFSDTKKMVLVK